MIRPYGLPIERLNEGKPIIVPTDNWWEDGTTFNPAALYLERSSFNDPIIKKLLPGRSLDEPKLRSGVVAVFYRAQPREDPGFPFPRSFMGLALFTPELELLERYPEPVIKPEEPPGYDYVGVEDARITRIGETFYALYCGFDGKNMRICMASSRNLLNWEKLGLAKGEINLSDNKDAVLFPEKIEGHYFMLHRPMVGRLSDFSIHLAISDLPTGVWRDCGMVLHSFNNPVCNDSWVGAGPVPVSLGNKRFLVFYHTGNYLKPNNRREYDMNAAIFNFQNFSLDSPDAIVESRIEPLMVPETEYEKNDSVSLDIVFPEGCYEYHDEIYILYGAGDRFVSAAKVNKKILIEHLEKSDSSNPFLKGN